MTFWQHAKYCGMMNGRILNPRSYTGGTHITIAFCTYKRKNKEKKYTRYIFFCMFQTKTIKKKCYWNFDLFFRFDFQNVFDGKSLSNATKCYWKHEISGIPCVLGLVKCTLNTSAKYCGMMNDVILNPRSYAMQGHP